jgi:uncharacterized protein (UPF0371 family)
MMKSKALQLAVIVIEGYQSDIRNLVLSEGSKFKVSFEESRIIVDTPAMGGISPTLGQLGFCQGSAYTKAIETIKKLATAEGLEV